MTLLRKVSKNEAQLKADKYGIKFYETSALDSYNIKFAFENLIKDIFYKTKNNYFSQEEKYKKHMGFDLNKLNKQKNKEEDDSFCGCSE